MKEVATAILMAAAIVLLAASGSRAENYTVSGEMGAKIRYDLRQQIAAAGDARDMTVSFVVPAAFRSPTYRQEIGEVEIAFDPLPDERTTRDDSRGNRIVTARWRGSPATVDCRISFTAQTAALLSPVETKAPFPLPAVPKEIAPYLAASSQVQSDHPRIRSLAKELTRAVETQFDAVQRISAWVADRVRYVNLPQRYDALSTLEDLKGNCQNYSHLSAALLRAVGIPVRIVNGVTLNRPFDVAWQQGVMTFKMGQGRHSWIEVWFPDLGWVPFDPQSTELFVSSRFIRIEVGADNNETKNDGLLKWNQPATSAKRPILQETINADFLGDRAELKGRREVYGPGRNILLRPEVRAAFHPTGGAFTPALPSYTEEEKRAFRYDAPFLHGNLEFPEGLDFAFGRHASAAGDLFEMRRGFLVETAEYVTTNLTQYAQVVILQRPVLLQEVGLALQRFGGSGSLWVDLFRDDGGKPGQLLATSALLNVDDLPSQRGYHWVDFDFRGETVVLMPGAYWIALGFSGDPIVNWFFTYGKPVGPAHGTRYKGVFQTDWSGAMNYEFNYRIKGRTVK